MKALQKSVKQLFDEHNWDYELERIPSVGYALHISWYSPAGEDLNTDIELPEYFTIEDIYDAFNSKYEDFDVDEHVEMWVAHRGEGGCPSTVKELLEDAEAIDDELREVVDELRKLYLKGVR